MCLVVQVYFGNHLFRVYPFETVLYDLLFKETCNTTTKIMISLFSLVTHTIFNKFYCLYQSCNYFYSFLIMTQGIKMEYLFKKRQACTTNLVSFKLIDQFKTK